MRRENKMRNKKEIIIHHEEISDQNLAIDHKARLHGAIQLEVQIDIRDALVQLSETLKEFEIAGQIYREHHPI